MLTEETIHRVIRDLKSTYALRKVSIFGSYAEGRSTANSDLDLLVEFEHPTVSLIKLNALKYALEDALGISVDVIHAPLPEGSMIHLGKTIQIL